MSTPWSNFQLRSLSKILAEQLRVDRSVLWTNGLLLLLLTLLVVYIKIWGNPVQIIFLFRAPAPSPGLPYNGLLTTVSNLLLCVAMAICAFSFTVFRTLHPRRRADSFFLYSALLLGMILLDRVFRITIILVLVMGISKIFMYLLYGIAALCYGAFFWRRILKTPYILLAGAGLALVLSSLVDLAHFDGFGTPAMLEGSFSLVGVMNLMLYFWLTSRHEIQRSLQQLCRQEPLQ